MFTYNLSIFLAGKHCFCGHKSEAMRKAWLKALIAFC